MATATTTPIHAVISNAGGEIARLEGADAVEITRELEVHLRLGWIILEPGDTIRIIDTREEG